MPHESALAGMNFPAYDHPSVEVHNQIAPLPLHLGWLVKSCPSNTWPGAVAMWVVGYGHGGRSAHGRAARAGNLTRWRYRRFRASAVYAVLICWTMDVDR